MMDDRLKKAQDLLDTMAKPPGSLGLLEKHLVKILSHWDDPREEMKPFHLIYSADNGIAASAIAVYPQTITTLQSRNMVAGGSTICKLCEAIGVPYQVADVGIDCEGAIGMNGKVRRGTRHILHEPAMTDDEYQSIVDFSSQWVRKVVQENQVNLLSFGEMGIGNTTTSAAVLCALTGEEPANVVGLGASAESDSHILQKKREIIQTMLEIHKNKFTNTREILQTVGGYDLVGLMAGMKEAAALKIPFMLDGLISVVACLSAFQEDPNVIDFAIPSHLSREPGMQVALRAMGMLPEEVVVQGQMSLGEGSGAILYLTMLKSVHHAAKYVARLSDFSES